MSKRTPSVVVKDILNCVARLESYTTNLSFEDFITNFMVVEACLYNIQIIGEAVSQLDDDVKANAPDVPWTLIKGMRNRLIHEYFGTDLPVVWQVIKNELPELRAKLEQIHLDLIQQGR